MGVLKTLDNKKGGLSFDLRHVLAALGPRAAQSTWEASAPASYDEPFDATGKRAEELEAVASSGRRITGTELLTLAEGVRQVIWGEFRAYGDRSAPVPWVIIRAIDSHFYEVVSDDPAVLDRVRAAFLDVEDLVKRITKKDGLVRVSICRRSDGLFYYHEDRFVEWDDAHSAWYEDYPPSGLYASAQEAGADARASIAWLCAHD